MKKTTQKELIQSHELILEWHGMRLRGQVPIETCNRMVKKIEEYRTKK